jgi:sugar phosphate isomerase/epimerase
MGSGASIKDWLAQVKGLGFDAVELSYKITRDQLKEAEPVLKDLSLKVSSIHNFCPKPDDGPSDRHPSNYYRLSSLDERERRQAVKWTKIAVDTARRVGAGIVVIHAGTLDFEDERSPVLFDLFVNGQTDTDKFREERKRILRSRDEKKAPYLAALEGGLREVMAYSQKMEVKIGLETRYYPIEIPNFAEIGYFLKIFGGQGMGYWHDVGHAEINGRLGIKPHREFLETYKDHLIGAHLHGVEGRRDHLAPFEGDMDLGQYLPYFGPRVVRVVESKSFASSELIKQAVDKLKTM